MTGTTGEQVSSRAVARNPSRPATASFMVTAAAAVMRETASPAPRRAPRRLDGDEDMLPTNYLGTQMAPEGSVQQRVVSVCLRR